MQRRDWLAEICGVDDRLPIQDSGNPPFWQAYKRMDIECFQFDADMDYFDPAMDSTVNIENFRKIRWALGDTAVDCWEAI